MAKPYLGNRDPRFVRIGRGGALGGWAQSIPGPLGCQLR